MWTPIEVRKLICQVCGILFAGTGVWLLVNGVQASGTIDINSDILSGKLESGSAGLFLLFLGFFLILFPALFGSKINITSNKIGQGQKEQDKIKSKLSERKKTGIVGVGLIITSVILLIVSSYMVNTLEMQVGVFIGFAGFAAGLVGAIIFLMFLISWISPDTLADTEAIKQTNKDT